MLQYDTISQTAPTMKRLLHIICLITALWPSILMAYNPVQVEITGVGDHQAQSWRNQLVIAQGPLTLETANQTRILVAATQGEYTLKRLLNHAGYYQPSISVDLSQPTPTTWHIRYAIQPGKRTIIHQARINITGPGSTIPALQHILTKHDLTTGQPFILESYQSFKQHLLQAAQNQGYIDAHWTQSRVIIDVAQHQANVALSLDTGERYHFGKTHFVQQGYPLSEKFLNKYLPYQTGQPYRTEALKHLNTYLNNTPYFTSTEVIPQPDPNTHTIPITVNLNAEKSQQYTLGVGHGTETGPRALLGWKFRHVGSEGQYIDTQAEFSKLYINYGASYIIPGSNPTTDYTSIHVGQSYSNIIPYKSLQTRVGINYIKQLFKHWQVNLGLNETITDATFYVSSQDNNTYYLLPSLNINYRLPSHYGYWQNGLTALLNTTGTIRNALSTQSFIQNTVDVQYALGLTRGLRTVFTGSAGAIASNHFDALSPTVRYYAGGVNNVRGYAYKSLSPKDSLGALAGGRYLLLGRVSIEQHIWRRFSGLAFYNVGNAFNQWDHFVGAQGAGIGLNWRANFGPIHLYFSRPIFNNALNNWRIDFSIGTSL